MCLQAHEPPAPCTTLGHHLFSFSLLQMDTNLPFFSFSIYCACSHAPDLCISHQDLQLCWDFQIQL